jgi:tetratricopeptide (TPR) repeat protein
MGLYQPPMKAYTTGEINALLGLSPRRIRDFARSGVLDPERGPRNMYLFGFRDLVLLRTARTLLDARVPQHRVLRALRRLKEQLPEGRSLTELRIAAEGDDVVVYDQGQAWDPESGQLRLAFDVAELAEQVQPLARRAVERAAAEGEESVDHLLDLGFDLEGHAPEQARRAYERVLELEPGHADALVNLGRLYYEEGVTEAAIVHYRRALESAAGRHPVAAFNLGLALEDVGRDRAASDAYLVAIAADPAYPDSYYNLARVYERLGDRVSALRCLKSYRTLTRQVR